MTFSQYNSIKKLLGLKGIREAIKLYKGLLQEIKDTLIDYNDVPESDYLRIQELQKTRRLEAKAAIAAKKELEERKY